MTRKSLYPFLSLSLVASLGLAAPASAAPSGEVLPLRADQSLTGDMLGSDWNAFTPPDVGVPGRREGGGTRGCSPSGTRLLALTPENAAGATAAEDPTLYFYLQVQETPELEFVLQKYNDSEEVFETVYEKRFEASESGIVSHRIDEDAMLAGERLEPGEDYLWYFSIICDPNDRSADVFANGWLHRTELSVDGLDARERHQAYRSAGLWYDALDNARQAGLTEEWNDMLQSVGLLDDIAANAVDVSAR